MAVFGYRKGFEPSLVKVSAAGRVAMGVPTLCVGVRQPAEESGEFTLVFGPKYEVPMIRHQAVSDEPNRMPVEGFEHLHIHLVPRVHSNGGFEQGTGVPINIVAPEEARRLLTLDDA